jgi:hypothetical protein
MGAAMSHLRYTQLVGRGSRPSRIEKTVDETLYLTRPRRGAVLKEEVWQSSGGEVVRYSLAYINPRIWGGDNGRVLGYDNAHKYHHRHFMGRVEPVEFESYTALSARFEAEVRVLWEEEDEKRQ